MLKGNRKFVFIALLLAGFFLVFGTSCNDDKEIVPDLSWTEQGEKKIITATNADGTTENLSVEIVQSSSGEAEAIIIDETEGDTVIFEFLATEEGIYDYVLSNGDKTKPSTLVEFNADVGTIWNYVTPAGTTVKRELMSKGDVYEVSQTYPVTAFEMNLERIEWDIDPDKGITSCTLFYDDQGPTTVVLN